MAEDNGPILEEIIPKHLGYHGNQGDNGLYRQGNIDGIDVNFLVDGGSSVSILPREIYDMLPEHHSIEVCGDDINDVSGNRIMVLGSMNLPIKLGDTEYTRKLLICQVNQGAILGQDFLLDHIKKINYERMTLQTHYNDEIQCWTGRGENMVRRIILKETITVPPHSAMMVPITVPGPVTTPNLGFIDANTAVNGLYIVPGVTDLNQEELAMSVINTGETPITVHAEHHMGTCTPFYGRPDEQSICVRSIQPDSPEHLDELPSHLQDLFVRSAVHLDESQMSSLKSLLIKFKDTFPATVMILVGLP